MDEAALRIQAAWRGHKIRRLLSVSWEQCSFGPEARSCLFGPPPARERSDAVFLLKADNPYSVFVRPPATADQGAFSRQDVSNGPESSESLEIPRMSQIEEQELGDSYNEPTTLLLSAIPLKPPSQNRPPVRTRPALSSDGQEQLNELESPSASANDHQKPHSDLAPPVARSPLLDELRREPIRFHFGPNIVCHSSELR